MTREISSGIVLSAVVGACTSSCSLEPKQPYDSNSPGIDSHTAENSPVGIITADELERFDKDWSTSVAQASVPPNSPWEGTQSGIELDVYLGTWCSDSVDVVGDFLRLAAVYPPSFPVRFFTLPEDRTLWPHDHRDLRYVPSFIVRRNQVELGRVVESAPTGIAEELSSLVTGRKRGVISGRLELTNQPIVRDHLGTER